MSDKPYFSVPGCPECARSSAGRCGQHAVMLYVTDAGPSVPAVHEQPVYDFYAAAQVRSALDRIRALEAEVTRYRSLVERMVESIKLSSTEDDDEPGYQRIKAWFSEARAALTEQDTTPPQEEQ